MRLLYPMHPDETALDYIFRMETSSTVFAILMLCFVGTSANYIFGTLLTANASLKQLNIISVTAMVLNIGLNFLLIPQYKAVGSALASLATQTFVAIAQVIVVFRIFKIKPNYWFILRFLLVVASTLLFALLSFKLPFSWIIKFLSFGLASLLFAMLARFFRIGYFVRIIRFGEQPGSQF